ncbi:MAG: hypothetical protein FWD26_05155 [Treponema sp.]|nr:hypothetical protein [Treponema sp.]
MKKLFFLAIVISLLLSPLSQAAAQTSSQSQANIFDTTDFPQWGKDLRRFDIIAFGVFPFSIFFVTFATDMFRWYNANGLDFSEDGRRYAPWPLKSAGAVPMTTDEQFRTILISAGVSLTVALVDLIIVKIKQGNERRRIERRPSGSVTIERRQISASEEEEEELTPHETEDWQEREFEETEQELSP